MKKVTRVCLGLAVACVLSVLGCVWLVGCDTWFYRPDRLVHGTAHSHDLGVEAVRFAAPGGPELHGWWVPAVGESRGTVVYFHGNHANLTHHARFVRWLPGRGFNLLLFDYRGFGESEGQPTRAGTVADGIAALDFALARDPDRTVLFGHSLGGAVGIVAAANRDRVRAIVVESSFPSYRAAARSLAPWIGFLIPLLVSEGLDPLASLAALPPRPLLIIHGTEDEITPVELGRDLFAAAHQPKRLHIVEGGGHVTPWVKQGKEFEDRLLEFFAQAIQR